MKLRKGMHVSTFNMNRETYNRVCEKFMTAGCPEGEYAFICSTAPPITREFTKRIGCYSNIFGMFHTIGWGPRGLYHADRDGATLQAVTVQDVLESV